jgi:hypothetical protein
VVRVDVVAVDVMTVGIDADTRVLVGMTRRGGRGPLIERRAQRGDRVVCVDAPLLPRRHPQEPDTAKDTARPGDGDLRTTLGRRHRTSACPRADRSILLRRAVQ